MRAAPILDHLRRLIAHLLWADERAYESLRSAAAPLPRATELYAHVVAAEHVWLARLQGSQPQVPVWPALTLEECGVLARATHDGLARYLDALEGGGLDREVSYTNSAGVAFRSRADDMLLQVALHGAYHRGQIAQLVRDAGAEPRPTDYIAFVRGAPAATRS